MDSMHMFEDGDEGGGEPVAVDNQSIEDDPKRLFGNVNYVPVENNSRNRKVIDDSYSATQQINGSKGEANYLR